MAESRGLEMPGNSTSAKIGKFTEETRMYGVTVENNKTSKQPEVQMSVDEIFDAITSENSDRQLVGARAAKRMLSCGRDLPIALMIERGIVPICVGFLDKHENQPLQLEAAWVLTNVVSGTFEQTKSVIDAGAIPRLAALLQSPSKIVAGQAAWALANIAGNDFAARDIVCSYHVIDRILRLVDDSMSISLLHSIVQLMLNLCRHKNPSLPHEEIKKLLPVLSKFLDCNDIQILYYICWTLCTVTSDGNYNIQAVINTGAVPKLIHLLDSNEPSVVEPALRTIGNIATGSDSQADIVIAAGGLPKIAQFLQSSEQHIVKIAAWSVSNIVAGNEAQIQEVLKVNIFYKIRYVLENGDFASQKEAAWAVTNLTACGTTEQVITLFDKYAILKPYLDLLEYEDVSIVKVVLTGLKNLFWVAEELDSADDLCVIVEEAGVVNKLEALLEHENEEVYRKAFFILDTYFTEEYCIESDFEVDGYTF